jgi:putative endonuclease
MLQCSNGKISTGYTQNLNERLNRHLNGHVPATKPLRPLKLHCYFTFTNKYAALNFEKHLKSGSGRAFAKKHFDIN